MHKNKRRDFLRLGYKTLCGAGLSLGAQPLMTLARAAEGEFQQHNDYRALVCIYLHGGSDGFSLLVPSSNAEYQEYANARQHLAISQSNLLSLQSSNSNIPLCGLNAQASSLLPLYENGKLAFLGNVGTMIEPTTKETYEQQSVKLPPQLFSHSDQAIQWQQLQGQLTSRNGWGALAARYLNPHQQKDYLTSVTVDGSNYWQSSEILRPFSIQSEGLIDYAGMGDLSNVWQKPRRDAFRQVLREEHNHVLTSAYSDLQQRAYNITTELGQELSAAPSFSANKPVNNELADQLEMVAQLISRRETLGMTRQIFFVGMKGWDVHDSQSRDLPDLFKQLADGMHFFQKTMDEIDHTRNVMAFTASDFGRTLSGNGDGTDHGWGNHHMIMGGAVAGGDIYGAIPRMSLEGPDTIRNSRVVPSISANQYAATLLRWLGLGDELLDQVLPDLQNFSQRDLGFVA